MTTTTNPLSTFITNAEAYLETIKERVEAVAAAFLPKAEVLVEAALETLATIAVDAVLGQASQVISGTEKFGAAVTNVIQTVEAQGKTVAVQTAQTAVQTAYLTIQNTVKGSN